MRIRAVVAWFGLVFLLVVTAGCGGDGGDGSRPDISVTTTTDAGAAGSSTSEPTTTTRPPITTTTREPITTTTTEGETPTTEGVTTTTEAVTTTTEAVTTTTAEAATTTTAPSPTTTAAADGEEAAPPTEPDSQDDASSWWWLALALAAAGLIGFLIWRRSRSGPPWTEQASLLANEIDSAGQSVLLGPDLTEELWTTALAKSNAVRAGAESVRDEAPSTVARQAVSEALDALRHAEVQASAARSGVGGAGDRAAAAAELSAAVERLRLAATPPTPASP